MTWLSYFVTVIFIFSGLYYGITIAIVSFATAMTVFTLNIHHKGFRGKAVPEYIKVICFGFLARLLCIRLDVPDSQHESSMVSVAFRDFPTGAVVPVSEGGFDVSTSNAGSLYKTLFWSDSWDSWDWLQWVTLQSFIITVFIQNH